MAVSRYSAGQRRDSSTASVINVYISGALEFTNNGRSLCITVDLVTFQRDIHVTLVLKRAPFGSIAVSLRCLLQAAYEGIVIGSACGYDWRHAGTCQYIANRPVATRCTD